MLVTLRPFPTHVLIAACALQVLVVGPAAAQNPSGVLELFTSQGCSSCPPADALLARLARDPHLLVLSMPVDYWDYIGWKDTLAQPAFSARQTDYCRARGDAGVYTPQVIVDGLTPAVGSDAAQIQSAISATARRGGTLSVDLSVREEGGWLKIDIGPGTGEGPKAAGIWLVRVARAVTVSIGRGENAGRSVTYTNVVRGLTKIGDWDGTRHSIDVPLSAARGADNDAYAVLLQAGKAGRPGVILAAARSTNL